VANDEIVASIREQYALVRAKLNERERRLWAAKQAKSLGRGGPTLVARATGLSRPTVYAGMRESDGAEAQQPERAPRARRPGGGRKSLIASNTRLIPALDALIEPLGAGRGDSPLRWTSRSSKELVSALKKIGHAVSARSVATILEREGYALEMNRHAGREFRLAMPRAERPPRAVRGLSELARLTAFR
jgi:hypothetical protein